MDIDLNKHSLALLKGIEPALKTFKQIEYKYIDIIERITQIPNDLKPGLIYLGFIPRNRKLDFFFRVIGVTLLKTGGHEYSFTYFPYSSVELRNRDTFYGSNLQFVVRDFESWIELIKEYNSLKLSEDELFLDDYTKEFYEEFKILDDDADVAPFTTQQQIFIYKWLEQLSKELKQSENSNEPKTEEIIEDIRIAQEGLPSMTKSNTMRIISRILAKIKTIGLKLIIDIFDVAKKEVLKKALYGGLDDMNNLYHHIF